MRPKRLHCSAQRSAALSQSALASPLAPPHPSTEVPRLEAVCHAVVADEGGEAAAQLELFPGADRSRGPAPDIGQPVVIR